MALALAAAAPALADGGDIRGDAVGSVLLAEWRGRALTVAARGRLCLVRGPDGSLRGEVAVGDAVTLDELLDRQGEGWTIVLAAGGDGTLNAWDREWSRLRNDAVVGLRLVAETLLAQTAGTLGQGSRRCRAPATQRHVLPRSVGTGGLRREMVLRARGRGGAQETLILTSGTGPDGAPFLDVRSSRRPGALRCDGLLRLPARYPAAETFVPLWPLRDLLELGAENPGTGAPADG